MRRLLATLLLAACQPIAEDAAGAIGPMAFETVEDDCRPRRFTGTTGNLFVGSSASNGRLVVASSLNAFWGPAREDAGTLIAGSRTDFATGTDVELVLGGEPSRRCATLRYRWSELGVDGGARILELKQLWLGVDPGCPEAYAHLPERECSSTRRVTFTPGPACRLQCLTPTADDFACGC